jgi:hypothetical protein
MTTSIFEFPLVAAINKVSCPLMGAALATGDELGVDKLGVDKLGVDKLGVNELGVDEDVGEALGVGVWDGSTSSTIIDVAIGSESIALMAN